MLRSLYKNCLLIIVCVFLSGSSVAQRLGSLPPFTKWYQNPLGIHPLNLHTSNGIILPALAATAVLLLTRNDSSIAKRFSFFEDAGVSWGYYASKTIVWQNNIGVLYKARSFMSLGGEVCFYHVSDEVNNTAGIGIRPFVRFYPVHKDRYKLFFQSGAGLILFADNFPKPSGFFGDMREGTQLNGCPKYGIGGEFSFSSRFTASLSLWHVHVSNGNKAGVERNPGHDSNGFSVGLIYTP